MTLKQALRQRVPRIRMERWANPNAYLRLPLLSDGMHGAWAELYDDPVQLNVLKIRPGSQRIPLFTASEDEQFVAYTGEPSEFEQHAEAFAKGYLES